MNNLQVGTEIYIIKMRGEPDYSGRTGKITFIDDLGQLHGTWGGLAINLDTDDIEIIFPQEPDKYPRYRDSDQDDWIKE